jgi:hypothetical protein
LISSCDIRKNPAKDYSWLYQIHTAHNDPLPKSCYEELNSVFKLIVKNFEGAPAKYMTVSEAIKE